MGTIHLSGESNQAADIKLAYGIIRDSKTPIGSVADIVLAANGKGSTSFKRNIYHLLNSPSKIIVRSTVDGVPQWVVAKPLGEKVSIKKTRGGSSRYSKPVKIPLRFAYTSEETRQGRLYNIIHVVVTSMGPFTSSTDLVQVCEKEYQDVYKEKFKRDGTFSGALTTMIISTNGTITGERDSNKSNWRNIRARSPNAQLPPALTYPTNSDRLGTPKIDPQLTLPLPPAAAVLNEPPPPKVERLTPPSITTIDLSNKTMDELEAWVETLSIGTAKALRRIITKILEE